MEEDKKDEFQTLYWLPLLSETASQATDVIGEMLGLITEFYEEDPEPRRSFVDYASNHHRQVVLGDMLDTEVVKTFVEVVPKSENTRYTILSTLKRHFLFSQLHDYELDDVIDAMQENFAEEGDIIIQEGDWGEKFYIMEEGETEISINGEVLARQVAPESFGDLALMYNSPRAATIKALTDCSMWTLDRVFFRQAMVTSSSNMNVQLCQFLSKLTLFENLGPQSLNQLARALTKQSYNDGEYIITQGQIGEQFYVLFKGTVVCTKADDHGVEVEVIRLKEGDVFGERALLKKEPRAANVIASGPVECYQLDSHNFTLMLGGLTDRLNEINEYRILRGASIFATLSDRRLRFLMKIFKNLTLGAGEKLLCASSGSLYIVLSGTFEDEAGNAFGVGFVTGGLGYEEQFCGDLIAISDECVVTSLHRQTLQEHMSSRETDQIGGENPFDDTDGRGDAVDPDMLFTEAKKMRSLSLLARKDTQWFMHIDSLSDFQVVSFLGRGTFGDVFGAQSEKTGLSVAVKCLDKDALIEGKQHLFVQREIAALQLMNSPFIVHFHSVFTSSRKVFLIMENIQGVELWTYLLKYGGDGPYGGIPIKQATVYAAMLLLALEHIHQQGYIFRDLKPENVMIAANGYVKLIDFGFAKTVPFINPKNSQLQYRTYTMCGSAEYMAPEVILTQGHDRSVDFWAFGVLLFEMLCRRTPFVGKNQKRTFEKIVESQKYISFQKGFDAHGKFLLRKLLNPNPSIRLGCLRNGCNDVKDHAFFSDIDFDKLVAGTEPMPFIPDPNDDITAELDVHFKDSVEMLDIELELDMEGVPGPLDSFFAELGKEDV